MFTPIARTAEDIVVVQTGAGVGEIAQLRREDLHQEQGVWLLWITPEVGGMDAILLSRIARALIAF